MRIIVLERPTRAFLQALTFKEEQICVGGLQIRAGGTVRSSALAGLALWVAFLAQSGILGTLERIGRALLNTTLDTLIIFPYLLFKVALSADIGLSLALFALLIALLAGKTWQKPPTWTFFTAFSSCWHLRSKALVAIWGRYSAFLTLTTAPICSHASSILFISSIWAVAINASTINEQVVFLTGSALASFGALSAPFSTWIANLCLLVSGGGAFGYTSIIV